MARYRLSGDAKVDIATILKRSEERYGKAARIRYRALLTAAMRYIAADPESPLAGDCGVAGVRRFHIRYSRDESHESPVANPVHAIFYRLVRPGLVEIVRVLHDRMEPRRHIGSS